MGKSTDDKLDSIVAAARQASDLRAQGYREQALKMYPHICGRCSREFKRANLQELTVHHRDHNHDNNPADGSNWELLCVYCHDNEHQRAVLASQSTATFPGEKHKVATFNPFAELKNLLKDRK